MTYLLVGISVMLIPLLLMVGLVLWMAKYHQTLMHQKEAEIRELLNRLMTKEWSSFLQVQEAQKPSISDEQYQGMSDAEELRRSGQAIPSLEEYFGQIEEH